MVLKIGFIFFVRNIMHGFVLSRISSDGMKSNGVAVSQILKNHITIFISNLKCHRV